MDQSGWRGRIEMWAQRAGDIPVGVWLLRGTVGLLGLSLLLWGIFILVDGILDQTGAS